MERKVQKERDAENGEFDDKEKFVTNAYKQKKLEMAEQEKEEKRKDMIEDVMDVTKQKDMSGFYKHFLNRQTRTANLRVRKEESSDSEAEPEAEDHADDDESLQILTEPKDEYEHEPKTEVKTEIKAEVNPDADSDFLSDSDEDDETKGAKNSHDVKADPDAEQKPERTETLEEFKARLKMKKERRLDIYRTVHSAETLEPFRQRYFERKEKRRLAGEHI